MFQLTIMAFVWVIAIIIAVGFESNRRGKLRLEERPVCLRIPYTKEEFINAIKDGDPELGTAWVEDRHCPHCLTKIMFESACLTCNAPVTDGTYVDEEELKSFVRVITVLGEERLVTKIRDKIFIEDQSLEYFIEHNVMLFDKT